MDLSTSPVQVKDKENKNPSHTDTSSVQSNKDIKSVLPVSQRWPCSRRPLQESKNANARKPITHEFMTRSEFRKCTDVQNHSFQQNHSQVFSTPVNSRSYNTESQFANRITPLYNKILEKISPNLARLHMTPGALKEKQQRLISQHKEIRQKGDQLRTGGGVSLWPHMVQMRLTTPEIYWLIVQAFCLILLTSWVLYNLHGKTFERLRHLALQVEQFCKSHMITENHNQTIFHEQIVKWHTGFVHLTNIIAEQFTVRRVSSSCLLYSLTYMLGLATRVYFLLDNMLAHNKLTPSRIKKWTCLLVVIGTWTTIMAFGLFLAHQLEGKLTGCVQRYSSSLAHLVISPLELSTYQAILLYWRSLLLDDACPGVVSVLGVVSVRHVVHYLQFYCVPIVTVIVSPVVKLCCACVAVYRKGEYVKASAS